MFFLTFYVLFNIEHFIVTGKEWSGCHTLVQKDGSVMAATLKVLNQTRLTIKKLDTILLLLSVKY